MLFVAYYRVSTDRQGRSGLGLDAQRAAVTTYIAGRGELAADFTEIESGSKIDRPQLAAALEMASRKRAVLVIARLDRLARNVAFIAGLMDSRVEFVACDMPHASRLTLHILAAVAEHEREMISQRTKAALAEAKRRGVRLGNPDGREARVLAAVANRTEAVRRAVIVLPVIESLQAQGLGLRAIARELERRGIKTARGGRWAAATVRAILARRRP
ncbi:recombinase family protein [Magnetospirillum molischianum]|uniref:Resolvase domain protein n=1 Tax=Magnetospirillum molischianum DSM 120 TaxID=1150626 RepID=H8FXV6_MAGML|nr:recombinase family protein [Magnetospirillum molischianum]CCG43194.1 Resolvase domain protein [Magnetospirillum molischianum DSM 120]